MSEHLLDAGHAEQLVDYLRFLRRKREQCVSEVATAATATTTSAAAAARAPAPARSHTNVRVTVALLLC